MRILVVSTTLLCGAAFSADPQTAAPKFAVASVRPSPPDVASKNSFDWVIATPGNVIMKGIAMIGAIKWRLQGGRLSDCGAGVDGEHAL